MIRNLLLELLKDLFVGLTPECDKPISYTRCRASFLLCLRHAGRGLIRKGYIVAALFLAFSTSSCGTPILAGTKSGVDILDFDYLGGGRHLFINKL